MRERVSPPFEDTKKPSVPRARSAVELDETQIGASLHGRTNAQSGEISDRAGGLTGGPSGDAPSATPCRQHKLCGRSSRDDQLHVGGASKKGETGLSVGGRGLATVELEGAMSLIATAGEQALFGYWPILRKRGRGDTVASLRFVLAEESKLLLTRTGRSSASTKSVGRDLPTGSAVGHTHTSITIKRKQDKQVARVRGR